MVYDEKINGGSLEGKFPQYVICSELSGIDVSNAKMSGNFIVVSESEISDIGFRHDRMDSAIFTSSAFKDVEFRDMVFTDATFSDCEFYDCKFIDCEMPCEVINSSFERCEFTGGHYMGNVIQNKFQDCVIKDDQLLQAACSNRFEKCIFEDAPLPSGDYSQNLRRNDFVSCQANGDLWRDNTLDIDCLYDVIDDYAR